MAALLGLLLAVCIGFWAVVAVGILGAVGLVASLAAAVAAGLHGRSRSHQV
jgi:hypothetical protein